jgi:hypothetical protein
MPVSRQQLESHQVAKSICQGQDFGRQSAL